METVSTVKEYQSLINKVRETKIPIKVKVDMNDDELEKGREELDMDGIEVIMHEGYDEIKILD